LINTQKIKKILSKWKHLGGGALGSADSSSNPGCARPQETVSRNPSNVLCACNPAMQGRLFKAVF